jgi:3-hydroxyisobutyrate dehydrogenase-like beta-hydroxyacid dehydrogenase
MDKQAAFIGMGIMGRAMAGRLLDGGVRLTVHSRTMSKADELVARGAKPAATAAEAAAGADVVFICVTDTPDVEAVILGDNGVAGAVRKGMIVVDHSTISPAATRGLAKVLASCGAQMLDAPVSGGDVGARNGTLSIMVGGDAAVFAKVEPMLRLMGKTITHCGPSGTGQLTKLANQILVSVTNLAVSEAMSFAKRNGLDLQQTLAAVGGGAASSWQLLNLGPKMIAGDFQPGFMVDLQQKDLRLVLDAARQSQAYLPASSLVSLLFAAAQASGCGREGTQALFKVLETMEADGESQNAEGKRKGK